MAMEERVWPDWGAVSWTVGGSPACPSAALACPSQQPLGHPEVQSRTSTPTPPSSLGAQGCGTLAPRHHSTPTMVGGPAGPFARGVDPSRQLCVQSRAGPKATAAPGPLLEPRSPPRTISGAQSLFRVPIFRPDAIPDVHPRFSQMPWVLMRAAATGLSPGSQLGIQRGPPVPDQHQEQPSGGAGIAGSTPCPMPKVPSADPG